MERLLFICYCLYNRKTKSEISLKRSAIKPSFHLLNFYHMACISILSFFGIQYLYNGGKQENLSEASKQCHTDLFFKSPMVKLHSTFSYLYKKQKSKEDEHRGRARVPREIQLKKEHKSKRNAAHRTLRFFSV